ncbi:MAG TPA: hypothetical protein VKA95_14785 [Nitrososphaeraceae archaeon]|nr:hypothetical protein [Nitrososphaeraceae archaeon]
MNQPTEVKIRPPLQLYQGRELSSYAINSSKNYGRENSYLQMVPDGIMMLVNG